MSGPKYINKRNDKKNINLTSHQVKKYMYHLQLSRLLPFFRGEIQTPFSSRCSYCQTKDWVFFGREVSLYAFLALVACSWLCKSLKTDLNMKQKEDKKKNRRKTLHSLCSVSALLLSFGCCIALIDVELRIQEHHRLMSHSATFCNQMQTKILRKVQQNYERWQSTKADGLKGHLQGTNGEGCTVL